MWSCLPPAYRIGEVLGRGGFGDVVRVEEGDMKYAMKRIVLSKGLSLKRIVEERLALEHCSEHPFIITMHASFFDNGKFCILMDLAATDLQRVLRASPGGKLSEPIVRDISAELLLALLHLHDFSILHRDVKPENVLIGFDGHVLLADFGLAACFDAFRKRAISFVGTEVSKLYPIHVLFCLHDLCGCMFDSKKTTARA